MDGSQLVEWRKQQRTRIVDTRLATDADGCGSLDAADDVVLYLKFLISDANPVQFPSPFNDPKYFRITKEVDAARLVGTGNFAAVLQVLSLPNGPDNTPTLGVSSTTGPTVVLSNFADDLVAVHEWIHTQGLGHRGSSTNPDENGQTNTESTRPDPDAVMNAGGVVGDSNEINNYERSQIMN